ncbi:MAG: glycerol kinase GlpK [Bacteroidales bacterium]|nr:glycerol kinase GlpK [Bacteroidales bacterium]
MKKYILSLDQGTSSCRAILFDQQFKIIAIEQQEFKQFYPKPGWVEQDPLEIWSVQLSVAITLLTKLNINSEDIAGIGITNQRETTVIWDKKTGEPIYNAIVWQDKRTASFCNELKQSEWKKYVNQSTGLWIDSYFSATKINWIIEHVKEARQKAENNKLLFGTIDTWLVWKLTNGKAHVTDYSNASRTMLYDIRKLDWDNKILELFNIPRNILPNVVDSSGIIEYTNKEIFGSEIPIAGIAGDQQASLFGQQCFDPGTAKNTYGTGSFILMNTGKHVFHSDNGLISTIAWGINGKINYALEGSVFIAGAAIKWLRDSLKVINKASESEKIANSIESSEGVYFVPAFSGLGAPYWDMDARGAIFGLTQGSTYKHIVRAALESLAFQSKDMVDVMYEDSKIELEKLFVDGGACANDFLMQFQADILNKPVYRPQNIETTALGAAFLAGLGTNFCTFEEINKFKEIDKVFEPSMTNAKRTKLYSGWTDAIQRVKC